MLDEIDLRVVPGEQVCLVGESGSGKSSLLRRGGGPDPLSAGRSRLEGPDLVAGRLPALGWVPQHPTVLPGTVLDNIALGRPGVDERIARAALEAVQLGPWPRSMPHGLRTPLSGLDAPLSLGERRRLAMARCLAGPAPRLWLLDEPTAGLDQVSARRLVTELGRIVDGVTAIIATHDPWAMTIGHRVIELSAVACSARASSARATSGRDRRRLLRCAPGDLAPAARPGPPRPAAGACRRRGRPAGELAALGLLATGAWLLLSASLRPPILLLSIAIGAVQLFSFLRGSARYAERLASHNLGLGLQAAVRSWLYRRLEQLLPAGLPGGDRGDLLGPADRETPGGSGFRRPGRRAGRAAPRRPACLVVTAAFLLPAAGWAILAAGVLATAGVTVTVILADRKAAALPAARAAALAAGPRVPHQRPGTGRPRSRGMGPCRAAERERVLGARTRAVAATVALGRGAWGLAGGAGLAWVAWVGAAAVRAWRISPVEARRPGLPGPRSRWPAPGTAGRSRPPARQPGHPCSASAVPRIPAAPWPGWSRTGATVVARACPGQGHHRRAAGGDGSRPHRPDPVIGGLDLERPRAVRSRWPGRAAQARPWPSSQPAPGSTDLIAGQLTIDGTERGAPPPNRSGPC